jgi:hypothetical protein
MALHAASGADQTHIRFPAEIFMVDQVDFISGKTRMDGIVGDPIEQVRGKPGSSVSFWAKAQVDSMGPDALSGCA